MTYSARTISIAAALVIAVGLVSGAYIFSSPDFGARTVDAQSTEELLRAYAGRDSDNDGLPDWQEALYGTDPQNPNSVDAVLLDGEAVAQGLVAPRFGTEQPKAEPLSEEQLPGITPAAGSLTEQFSRAFFEQYIKESQGGQLTPEEQQVLMDRLLAAFAEDARGLVQTPYTAVSVRTSSLVSVPAYAGAVENVFLSDNTPPEAAAPIPLIERFVQGGDQEAKARLVTLEAAYEDVTRQLLVIVVPPELADEHLALIQGFDTLARSTEVVGNFEEDPLAVFGALGAFQPASQTVVEAMKGIATRVLQDGEPSVGAQGYTIVQFARLAETP